MHALYLSNHYLERNNVMIDLLIGFVSNYIYGGWWKWSTGRKSLPTQHKVFSMCTNIHIIAKTHLISYKFEHAVGIVMLFLIAHPHLLVQTSSERFLPSGATFKSWFSQWEPLVVTSVGAHRSLVPRTSKCGWTISHLKSVGKPVCVGVPCTYPSLVQNVWMTSVLSSLS